MRRAVVVLAATGGGLALLANFHTTPAPSGVAEPATDPTSAESDFSDAPTTTVAPTTTLRGASTTVPITTTTTTAPGNGLPTIDGPIATNRWGDVQVRVTLDGTQLVDIRALRLPGDNSHSAALSREAAPILRKEALQAQSAHIDVVSGATLTSESYIASLQGALDRAGR